MGVRRAKKSLFQSITKLFEFTPISKLPRASESLDDLKEICVRQSARFVQQPFKLGMDNRGLALIGIFAEGVRCANWRTMNRGDVLMQISTKEVRERRVIGRIDGGFAVARGHGYLRQSG